VGHRTGRFWDCICQLFGRVRIQSQQSRAQDLISGTTVLGSSIVTAAQGSVPTLSARLDSRNSHAGVWMELAIHREKASLTVKNLPRKWPFCFWG